ncbi:MAG: ABC transporter substrate-binding protein [Thermoplasmata archaeon]|nr:ABC transporter substrate-binding protein [Thermoplasmata archaeon]
MASAILIVVVLALVGVGTYAVMGGFSKGSPLTCQPITAPACARFQNLHDIGLQLPFKSVQEGNAVPFTVSLPSGESSTTYNVNFGDGTPVVSSHSQSVSHAYASIGTFLVYVTATVNGVLHDNLYGLVQVGVTASYSSTTAGTVPGIAGLLVSNTTAPAGTPQVTGAILTGQSVTVSASYTTAPTNPAYTITPPTMKVSTGGTLSNSQGTSKSSAGATASFNSAGSYDVSFVGGATNNVTTVVISYNWTVFVAPAGLHPGVAGLTNVKDPHPGTIISYELAPGGGLSEDPAIDYETVGTEPIINVYQTLITYNGSVTGPTPDAFVPELATCVPGSAQCASMYKGDTLVSGWNYTFVIQPNATFWDPTTGSSWPLYPTDVMFSMMRTLGFATLPFPTANPGWIIAQSLLSPGNTTWDSIHGSYNNTPANVSAAMTINGTDCPQSVTSNPNARGCITFSAHGHNQNWPYFLELVADPLGGSVVPCGWFSAPTQAAGIPFWTRGNVSGSGDHPCPMPGSGGYGVPFSQMPAQGWDQWEQLGSGSFGGSYLGHVQWNMVGSGPYSVENYQIAVGYTLKANPSYSQNPDCTWTGCQPKAGSYASTVEVSWENTQQPGEQAYIAGTADLASIPSTDFSLFIQLINLGKIQAITAPTISIGFDPFDLSFNVGAAQKYTTSTVNVPSTWFSYLGMREFFARAYPYATILNTIQTKDGIQLGFDYGGAIPQFMANYYPTNIPWPNTDPCSDASNVSCPIYWWNAMHDSSGPYFDPQVVGCTSANPCQMPIFGQTGNPPGDQILALWTSELQTLSQGAIKVSPVDIDFIALITNSQDSGPGNNPMPLYTLGWAPDYPDPTDYTIPLYNPNATYTDGDSVEQSLYTPAFTTGCAQSYKDYSYWANQTITQSCQGIAYKSMLAALTVAASTPAGPLRVELYDQAEKIAYGLALYTYTGQSNLIASVAAWLNPSSVNTNVTIGGGGDTVFYNLSGNDLVATSRT